MNKNIGLLMASSAISIAIALPAAADSAPSAAPSAAPVEEIIVTARRKDESLSKTPLTVAVLGTDQLAKQQIVTESDLRTAVPGLSVRAGSNSNQLNYSIRGNSQDAFSGTRPGVLPYINEVQIGGSGGASAFYDLQSVQVLKGPQGTLFGRSATGGAVLFTTAKPTNEFGGYASALVGDYGAVKLEGAINAPLISDKLLMRVAGFYEKRDGFQHNVYDNSRDGDINKAGGRFSLTFKPTASLRNELVVDYYHSSGTSTEAILGGLLPLSSVPGQPPFLPLQDLYAGTATPAARATGIATLEALTGAPAAAATAYYDSYFANPQHPNTGLLGVLATQQARGPYVIDQNGADGYLANNVIVTNATSLELGANTTLKNIFGYTHLHSFTQYETDGTPYSISQTGDIGANTGFRDKTEQISDEIQLLGKGFGTRLDYVTGFYVSHERDEQRNDLQYFDLFFGGSTGLKHFVQKNQTYAGYAQGTYRLGDSGLAFTLGARFTSEKVGKIKLPDDTDVVSLGTPAPAGYSYNQSTTYNRLSWNIGLQDQLNNNILLYAASRRAYKSGGYVGTSPPKVGFADVAGDAFKDERVTDIEVGTKFHGDLGGMPSRLDLAGYYQWIKNSQRTAYTLENTGPAAITVNVPTETAYGAEVDGELRATGWLTLGGNVNYIHPRFGSAPAIANGVSEVFDQVPDTPELTGIAYSEVTVPVSGHISAVVHGEVYAQKKSFTSPRSDNDQGTIIAGYALANFRAGIQNDSAGWSLTANLKNAFNKTYYVGGLPVGEIYQLNLLIPGDRRTFTVELRAKF